MAGDVIEGVVLGIGAPNRTHDGRAVQCAIVLANDHGLCRVFADFDGTMNAMRVWDRVALAVHIHAADQRAESWKLDAATWTSKVCDQAEKRHILEACVLDAGQRDPIDLLDDERRSIGVVRPRQVGMGYGMEVRDFDESPDWVMAQCETPQKPYLAWQSAAGKSHRHQICAHEAYEWLRKNPSRTSQLFDNLRIADIDYDKWLVVGNTKDRRNVWVVVCVHRLKKNDPTTYPRKLLDRRWKAKRLALFAARGHRCEACCVDGAATVVHHVRYHAELEPWEYDDADYMLVCKECHRRIHGR